MEVLGQQEKYNLKREIFAKISHNVLYNIFMKKPKITAILAMTEKGVIGDNNTLIWDIPEDMRRFREFTTGNVVIMGKNTYFSLPPKFRPLPHRRNIVFTPDSISGVECVTNTEQLFEILQNEKRKIFLIGGAMLYNYFFEKGLVDEVELTLVEGDYIGNVVVQDFRNNFREIRREKFSQ